MNALSDEQLQAVLGGFERKDMTPAEQMEYDRLYDAYFSDPELDWTSNEFHQLQWFYNKMVDKYGGEYLL